jgi:hypothetical protein
MDIVTSDLHYVCRECITRKCLSDKSLKHDVAMVTEGGWGEGGGG